jgi:molybdenum cofactor cytidylyltransferase
MKQEIARGVEAIVLAAGASSRLGRPKALLSFDGRTALEIVLGALREAGVESGVVVVGEHATEIQAALDPQPFGWVQNPDPDAGRLGSLQVGLRAIRADADVLLWPVDRPLAPVDTLRALLDARAARLEPAVIVPEAEGRRGHPILIRALLRERLLFAPSDASLRELIRQSRLERCAVPVNDPAMHLDIDTREDYEKALAWWRRRQRRHG